MDSVAANINALNIEHKQNTNTISRQSFLSRYNSLPLDFFKSVYEDIGNQFDLMNNKSNKHQIIAVDGSSSSCSTSLTANGYKTNKNNKSITALNLGIYNVTSNTPISIDMVSHNNERKAFLDYVKNKNNYENHIFVFDRGFDGFKFYKSLESQEIKYVCRIKENSSMISDKNDNILDVKVRNSTIKIRVIRYIINNKSYYLATNLFDDKEFTIDVLTQIYHYRWTIEEKFKLMKNNFKFAKSELKNEEAIKKSIYCQLFVMKMISVLDAMAIKKKFKKNNNGKRVVNANTLITGMYSRLLYLFILGKLSRKKLTKFNKCYIIFITTNAGKHNPRTCVTPFMKWYIKQHFKKYTKSEQKIDKNVNTIK